MSDNPFDDISKKLQQQTEQKDQEKQRIQSVAQEYDEMVRAVLNYFKDTLKIPKSFVYKDEVLHSWSLCTFLPPTEGVHQSLKYHLIVNLKIDDQGKAYGFGVWKSGLHRGPADLNEKSLRYCIHSLF